eukprot:5613604-Amphidinium_carterae.1
MCNKVEKAYIADKVLIPWPIVLFGHHSVVLSALNSPDSSRHDERHVLRRAHAQRLLYSLVLHALALAWNHLALGHCASKTFHCALPQHLH